jgi:hypothetical protein
MINIKKLILASALITITGTGMTQTQLGVFAGPQAISSKYTVRGEKQPITMKYGFQAGGMLKIPFDNKLFFTPAVFYSYKGFKVKFNEQAFPPDTNAVDNDISMHTAELAFLLQYDLGKDANHFFIKLGPTLDFQLFGRQKFRLENNTTVNEKIVFDFGEYGRFGASMQLQFGYETASGFTIFGQYSHGLGSINNADGGPRIRYRVYNISVGKYLSRKKIVIDTKNRQ